MFAFEFGQDDDTTHERPLDRSPGACRGSGAPQGSIVVGLNGEPHSAAVLAWAVVRAIAGRNTLVIVHVVEPRASMIDPCGVTEWSWPDEAWDASAAFLNSAVEAARAFAPGLRVHGRLLAGNPASILLTEGRTAELLIIGGHVQRTWRRHLPWSIEKQVRRTVVGRLVIIDVDDERLV